MRKSLCSLIWLGLIFVAFTACSTGSHLVKFDEPSYDLATHSNNARLQIKKKFYIDRVVDAREKPGARQIGIGQTGIWNVPTPMTLDDDFEVVVSKILTLRMRERGFIFADAKSQADYIFQVNVRNLSYSERTTFTTEHGICDADLRFLIKGGKSKQMMQLNTSARVEVPGLDVTGKVPSIIYSCLDMIVIKLIDSGML